jgi:hypothetical protein
MADEADCIDALEYYHPGAKFNSFSRMGRDGHSRSRMVEERWELLCANCHPKLDDEEAQIQ